LKKVLTYIPIIFALACHAQPGTTDLAALLRYVDRYGEHLYDLAPRIESRNTGLLNGQLPMGPIDSFYYYFIHNGERTGWTHKTVILADTIVLEYGDTSEQTFSTTTFSKKSGLKLSYQSAKNSSEYHYYYNKNWQLDSISMRPGQTRTFVTVGDMEFCRWKKDGHLMNINTFDENGRIIRTYGGYSDGKLDSARTYTVINIDWQGDNLFKTQERRIKDGVLTHEFIREYVRDANDLVKTIKSQNLDYGSLIGSTTIRYETGKNEKGQTTVTQWFADFHTIYTFDDRGNWVSIVGDFTEKHRVLFYKN
jgi:hypothetical protein